MIRKYHHHKLLTNPWHREKEPHETPGRQTKKRNQLSSPSKAHKPAFLIKIRWVSIGLEFISLRCHMLKKVDMTMKCYNHRLAHGIRNTSEHWKPSKTHVQARIMYISKLVNPLYQSEMIAKIERTHNSDYKFKTSTVSDSKYSAMIGCLWTRVRKLPIIALYFESENEFKFYNLKAVAKHEQWKHKTILNLQLCFSRWYNITNTRFLSNQSIQSL